MFSIAFCKLLKPFVTASTFSVLSSCLGTPPCILRARNVATITIVSGKILP